MICLSVSIEFNDLHTLDLEIVVLPGGSQQIQIFEPAATLTVCDIRV